MNYSEKIISLPEAVMNSIVILIGYLHTIKLNQAIITDYGDIEFNHVAQIIHRKVYVGYLPSIDELDEQNNVTTTIN